MKNSESRHDCDSKQDHRIDCKIYSMILLRLLYVFVILVSLSFCQNNIATAQDDGDSLGRREVTRGDCKVVLFFDSGISSTEQKAVMDAVEYWLSVTNPPKGTVKFEVKKSTDLEQNAAAISLIDNSARDVYGNTTREVKVTGAQSILADGATVSEMVWDNDLDSYRRITGAEINDGIEGIHAQILIGTGWSTSTEYSQSGSINNNLLPVIIHEMAHVLGMSSSVAEKLDSDGNGTGEWNFANVLTRWDSMLRDNNGDSAKSGQRQKIGNKAGNFILGNPNASSNPSHATFYGSNALYVLYDGNASLITQAGKTGGVPVTGYTAAGTTVNEDGEEVTSDANWEVAEGGSLSHVDTWNSLLSWQQFRNFQGLIEIEMAVFKDLGYTNIETREFFGQSYYVNGDGKNGLLSTQQIADRGFGLWNGQSYDTSQANTSMFGIGLHLFSNNQNVLQKGTIYASGKGSAGIRVDGVGNYLTTDTDSIIKMGEDNGIGLLVSFGKEHVIVHRGEISAYAKDYTPGQVTTAIENGIAASFDFGSQLFITDEDEAEGTLTSYLRSFYIDPDSGKKLAATDGPLVRRFDVTGKLYGSRAAIYIGKTAYVEQINLMQGTDIAGAILSYYKTGSRTTQLNFGLLAGADGTAQAEVDPNFNLVLSYNINYDTSLIVPTGGRFDITLYGGATNFNSNRVAAHSFNVNTGASLLLGSGVKDEAGKFTYTRITSTEGFINDGILAGTGDIRAGRWQFDDLEEGDDATSNTNTTTGEDGETTNSDWSESKIAFWKYSLPKGDDGYEQYFFPSGKFYNRGTISPGVIGGTISDDRGEWTVGQIDVHGDLTFTEDSTYNLTINGIPFDQTTGRWGIDSDALWVDGTTTMNGTLKVFLTDEFKQNLADLPNDDPVTYQIIRSEAFHDTRFTNFKEMEFGSEFKDIKISGVYVNPYDSTVAQVTLFPNPHYFEEKGNTFNTRSVGRAVDSATWDAPDIAFSLLGSKDEPAVLNNVLHQIATDVRANSIMTGILNPSRVLFPRIGWGNGQMATGEHGRINWNVNKERSIMNRLPQVTNQFPQYRGQAPKQQLRMGSAWFDYIGQSISSPSDGNSSGYTSAMNGGMLGGEWNITQHSAIGITMGYTDGTTRSGNNKVDADNYFGGFYFVATPFNQYEIKAYVGLGRQSYTMLHSIYNSSLKNDLGQVVGIYDTYYGRTDGTTINTSYEITRPIMITDRFILRPTFGVDSQYAWQDGFTEELLSSTSGGLYTLSFGDMYLNHNMLRLGLNSESIGPRGSLWLRGFYNFNFGGHGFPTSTARFTRGGDNFDIRGADIGWDAVNLGVGFNYWLNAERSASLVFDFNTDLFIMNSGASAYGLRVGFVRNF